MGPEVIGYALSIRVTRVSSSSSLLDSASFAVAFKHCELQIFVRFEIGSSKGMSLHIYVAHTGEHFLADPVSFASYVPSTLEAHPY